jgi:hypothetical protein
MRIDSSGAVGINNSSPNSFATSVSTSSSLVIGQGASGVSPGLTLWQGNSAQATINFASANTGAGQYEGRIRYTRDTGVMDFRTNNVDNVLVLNASGNVGIGTSPTDKFDVFSSSNNQRLIRISHPTDPTQASGFLGFNSDGTTNNNLVTLGVQYSGAYFNALNIQRSTRYIGIGEETPDQLLHLKGTAPFMSISHSTDNGTSGILFRRTDNNQNRGSVLYDFATDAMTFRASTTGTGEDMRIDSSGNVLVGKTATSLTTVGVELKADGNLIATRAGVVTSLNREDSDGTIIDLRKDGTSVGSIGTKLQSSIQCFYIAGSATGIGAFSGGIYPSTSDGSFSDNTKDLGTSSVRFKDLYLSGSANIDTSARIGTIDNTTASAFKISNNAGSGNYTYGMTIEDDSTNTGFILFAQSDGTSVGSITRSGTSTSYSTSSDYRLKENVVAMTGALDRVDQLNPSRFNFIADADTTVDGFLAHEVADVVPEAITGEKDAVNEEGNPIYQGIDQSKLVPLLVGAIQELRAEIEQLKNQ